MCGSEKQCRMSSRRPSWSIIDRPVKVRSSCSLIKAAWMSRERSPARGSFVTLPNDATVPEPLNPRWTTFPPSLVQRRALQSRHERRLRLPPPSTAGDLSVLEFPRVIPMTSVHPGFLGLLRRLEATGFVPGRRLCDMAYEAHDAVHLLTFALHSDTCDRHPTEPVANKGVGSRIACPRNRRRCPETNSRSGGQRRPANRPTLVPPDPPRLRPSDRRRRAIT